MPVTNRVKIQPQAQLGAQVPLNIPAIKQEQTNWCWAACAKMTTDYYGNDLPRQCDFVNWLFKQTKCCQNGSTAQCNRTASDPQITSVYTQWGINSTYKGNQVTFANLQEQISVDHPVEIGWSWHGGGGHVVLVVGCTSSANVDYVYVNDPWTGQSLITYASLKSGQGHGIWDASWINIVEM